MTAETDSWAPAEIDASTEESTDDAAETESDGGWWATAVAESDEESAESDTDDSDDADDTDSFLESVFSQLNDVPEGEADGEDDDETGFSMGLLRRRRMGTAARDLTND